MRWALNESQTSKLWVFANPPGHARQTFSIQLLTPLSSIHPFGWLCTTTPAGKLSFGIVFRLKMTFEMDLEPMKWSFLFSLGPIRASCVMSRFSSHAHHGIFQHGMQLWITLVKPKRQWTFWLVILIYDQTKWILKGTDNILMSGYGNKCQNACRGKLNKRLIKLAAERIWSVHRVVQEMSVGL